MYQVFDFVFLCTNKKYKKKEKKKENKQRKGPAKRVRRKFLPWKYIYDVEKKKNILMNYEGRCLAEDLSNFVLTC